MEVLLHKEVSKFIGSLEKRSQAKILWSMELLKSHGKSLGMPYVRYLSRDIYELRIRGVEEVRLLFVYVKNSAIILSGFKKKTQQTPYKEIELALKRRIDLD